MWFPALNLGTFCCVVRTDEMLGEIKPLVMAHNVITDL